ncbi:MAG: hypothetical protein ACREMJ_04810 [Gemmatimonadales bacterium]
MATYQLRPMSFGEILDGAFVLLRRHFGVLFSVAIICQGIPTALTLFVIFAGGTAEAPGLAILGNLLSWIGYLFVTGATVRIVSEAYLGRTPTVGDALGFAAGKAWRIFLASLASSIVIGLSAVPGVVAGIALHPVLFILAVACIVVFAGYSIVIQAAALEPLASSTDALGRSWTLTKGFKGKAFGLWGVLVVILMLLFVGFGVVAGIAAALAPLFMIPAVAALAVLWLLIYPLISAVFTLLYYDLRVRKEAFDLELLSQQIGLAPTSA